MRARARIELESPVEFDIPSKHPFNVSEQGELIVEHNFYPKVLETYNWLDELVELLIINVKAVRMTG